MRKLAIALTGLFVLASSSATYAQSLRGSSTAMRKQNRVAQAQDYTFLRTSSDVKRFVASGYLVPVTNTSALELADVSFPYARPAVKTFAERLSSQYKNACGDQLVVTSLTRPISRQPRNAHELSVHPAGMALDIRMSNKRSCRSWLENTLISLEKKGILDATRERYPAHYHVAVFPTAYFTYLGRTPENRIAKVSQPKYASVVPLSSKASGITTHKVRAGQSLWTVARKYGVTVNALKQENNLRTSVIRPGQVLRIPQARSAGAD